MPAQGGVRGPHLCSAPPQALHSKYSSQLPRGRRQNLCFAPAPGPLHLLYSLQGTVSPCGSSLSKAHWGPGLHLGVPCGCQGPQVFEKSPAASRRVHQQEAGMRSGAETQTHATQAGLRQAPVPHTLTSRPHPRSDICFRLHFPIPPRGRGFVLARSLRSAQSIKNFPVRWVPVGRLHG